jgi:tRNA(Ser,Leu) C12 N-acetylase TAN1
MADWNVLATSLEGQRDMLLGLLRGFGRFRRAGYRNVVVGRVDDVPAVLDRVRDALAHDPFLPSSLAKLVPIEKTVRIDARNAAATLAEAAEPFVDRLACGSFFVRLERRGLKGQIHSPTLEREVADPIWRALESRGVKPRVDFADPDNILVIETVGDDAGLAVLDRALRRDYPFVKVR